jgi:uncharacterized protein YndB with AHSA1/START domain
MLCHHLSFVNILLSFYKKDSLSNFCEIITLLTILKLYMDTTNTITVQTTIEASVEEVWEYWTQPEHITQWAFASDDWEAPSAENDMRVGGKFKTTMAAKDKSSSFDFRGIYSAVIEHQLIEYDMDDGRHVKIEFEDTPAGIKVTETFAPETENSLEVQRGGWQAILDNFKKYTQDHA